MVNEQAGQSTVSVTAAVRSKFERGVVRGPDRNGGAGRPGRRDPGEARGARGRGAQGADFARGRWNKSESVKLQQNKTT